MAKVRDVIKLMNMIAPEQNVDSEGYDNVGLQVGKSDREVSAVLCCLDVTEEVVEEAVELGANMIITHHPLIFAPIKSVSDRDVTGRKILAAVESGVSVYAAHTNLDFSPDGINDFVARALGLKYVEPLHTYGNAALGRVGELETEMPASELKYDVESVLSDRYVRIIGEPLDTISRVAVINGAGGGSTDYIDMALNAEADCLVTADVKHHVAVYARDNGLVVIEAQHYTMEHCYIGYLTQKLNCMSSDMGYDVEFIQSAKDINPRN